MNRNTGILECQNISVLMKCCFIATLFYCFRQRWKTIVLLLSLNLGAIVASAQVKASVHLDSSYILIGDQVQMQLFLDSAINITDIKTDFSVWDSLTFIEVVEQGEWNQVSLNRSSGTALLEQRIVVTSFEAGKHVLPKTPIRYKINGEERTVMPGNTLTLEVGTIAVSDSTQLNPIKTIIEEPKKLEDYLPYFLAIAAIGLLVGLFFLIRRLTRKREVPPPPPIILKPYEIALQKLEALKEEKLWQQGLIKEYQTELTFVIREYLENQFQIPALENTTDEIISSLQKIGFAPEWQARLRNLFQNADLVKFAKAEPPIEIHEEGMNEAVALVWETKPVEELEALNK